MTHLANPRIIERMPLHEITARFGERGLCQGQAKALILRQLRTASERFAVIAQQEGR